VRCDLELGDGDGFPGEKEQGVPLWTGLVAASHRVDLVDLVKHILQSTSAFTLERVSLTHLSSDDERCYCGQVSIAIRG
jgi:hypothetical protein